MKSKWWLVAVAVLLVIAVTLSGCSRSEVPELDEPGEYVPSAAELEGQMSTTVSTVVYYTDDNGYLVPVMRRIPWEDGIAKATLGLMVASTENLFEAAKLGLTPALPAGTEFDLDIAEGVATVNLIGDFSALDAVTENAMVQCIVQSLTEFPSVEQVALQFNGQVLDTLNNGTPVSAPISRAALNYEIGKGDGIDAQSVMLYFSGTTGQVIVPVTRSVYSQPDMTTAVLELLRGPKSTSPLQSPMPADCGLIGIDVKDGIATINLSKEFLAVENMKDGGQMALKALMLTCTQFPGITQVKLLVDGEPFEPTAKTVALPVYVNAEDDYMD